MKRSLLALALALLALLPGTRLRAQSPGPGELLAPRLAGASARDTPTEYQMQQGWFSRDKAYHFGVSAVGAGALYAGGRRLGLGRWQSLAASALVMGTVGMLREVVSRNPDDVLTEDHLSRRDLVWDGVGIAVGLSVSDRLFRHPDPARVR